MPFSNPAGLGQSFMAFALLAVAIAIGLFGQLAWVGAYLLKPFKDWLTVRPPMPHRRRRAF
jgi:hypothetical protein